MVGREKEKRELDKLYASNQAELVAIYGAACIIGTSQERLKEIS